MQVLRLFVAFIMTCGFSFAQEGIIVGSNEAQYGGVYYVSDDVPLGTVTVPFSSCNCARISANA